MAAVIYSNNSPLSDQFTNPTNLNLGQAIGSSGWYYNNVRNNGTVGVRASFPYLSSGSVFFQSPSGAAKADIEYLPNAANVFGNYVSGASLGRFSDLQSFSYSWYRSSSSTVASHLHPVMRVLLDADGNLATTGDRGGLVFERVYNSGSVAVNTWVSDTVSSGTYLWNFGLGLGFAANINATPFAYDATLAEWQAYFPNALVIGFSAGVGSGWNGVFSGAVDSISWSLAGQSLTFNFEVAPAADIPEPSTLLLTASGAALLLLSLRR
ncbi:MAG: PEP-CTERM sorting domain-containing protein [Bryobacteraceae bacterium]|nr:PEP-CTERM sorting domain-containing protein [Bryobacteraceae bacterium]MDW8379245.1 PEP-CTERM sorting domain-containing protein [Bryobacterales bacterium]